MTKTPETSALPTTGGAWHRDDAGLLIRKGEAEVTSKAAEAVEKTTLKARKKEA